MSTLCACMYAWCALTCEHPCRGQREDGVFYHPLPHCLEAGCLIEPEALSILARLAGLRLLGPMAPSSDNAGITPLTAMHIFFFLQGLWGFKPRSSCLQMEQSCLRASPEPQGCLSNPLLVKKPCRFSIAPSPQTNFLTLKSRSWSDSETVFMGLRHRSKHSVKLRSWSSGESVWGCELSTG